MRIVITLFLLAVSSVVWAAEKNTRDPSDASRECVKNFTAEGSLFKGKTYKTWQDYHSLEYEKVFQIVARAVAEDGWNHVNANKELGIINASQVVIMGEGSVAPLNMIVKANDDGSIRVEAVFTTSGGQKAGTKAVRKGLCKLVEAAAE